MNDPGNKIFSSILGRDDGLLAQAIARAVGAGVINCADAVDIGATVQRTTFNINKMDKIVDIHDDKNINDLLVIAIHAADETVVVAAGSVVATATINGVSCKSVTVAVVALDSASKASNALDALADAITYES